MNPAWAPVVGAGLGASAVLISQLFAWRAGGERLKLELRQRDREMMLRYSEPIRDKWLGSLEKFHELLQDVLENGRLSERDYLDVRPYFAYIDDDLRNRLLATLTTAAGTRGPLTVEQRDEMLQLQSVIRSKIRVPEEWKDSS